MIKTALARNHERRTFHGRLGVVLGETLTRTALARSREPAQSLHSCLIRRCNKQGRDMHINISGPLNILSHRAYLLITDGTWNTCTYIGFSLQDTVAQGSDPSHATCTRAKFGLNANFVVTRAAPKSQLHFCRNHDSCCAQKSHLSMNPCDQHAKHSIA